MELKRIINKIKGYVSGFFFGLKSADRMMSSAENGISEQTGVHEVISQSNVLEDLLKGEETQQVQELRWEIYRAEELANDYQYLGNGVAMRIMDTEKERKTRRKKFTQLNYEQTYSYVESIQEMEKGNVNLKKRMGIVMEHDNPNVRFKLGNYIEKVGVDMREGLKTVIYIGDDPRNNKENRPVVTEIKKTMNDIKAIVGNQEAMNMYAKRNELCKYKSLSFVTFNATNNVPNGIEYTFVDGDLCGISIEDGVVKLTYEWRDFQGGQLLSEKYDSESARRKFDNKEKRKKEYKLTSNPLM